MSALKTILLPTDYSAASEHALTLARDLALAHDARLIVLHVIEPPLYCGEFNHPGGPPPSFLTSLHRWLGRCGAGGEMPAVEGRIEQGFAWEEILRVAGECHCDLIVMGSEGKRGIERALLGSNAEQVARHAACPVLISKATPHASPGGSEGVRPPPFSTILFPTDLSDRARAAFPVAMALAAPGSRLLVVHVMPPGQVRPEEYESALVERLRALYPAKSGIAVDYLVAAGDPAEMLPRVAAEAGCDLIVMASQGRTGLRRLLMGSVAEMVSRAARAAVVLVHAADPAPAAEPKAAVAVPAR